MAIRITYSQPERFSRFFDREIVQRSKQAVRIGVEAATEGLKQEMRQAVFAAGLGERLGQTIRSETYPAGERYSFRTAGSVWVVEPKKRSRYTGGAPAIFDAFINGRIIQAEGGFLAIPLPTVPARTGFRGAGGTQMGPRDVEEFYGRKLELRPGDRPGTFILFMRFLTRTISRRRKGARFKAYTPGRARQGREAESVDFFILVRSARIPLRLRNFDDLVRTWTDRVPELIERASARLGAR
jgi:hypothetical protein